MLLSPPSEDVLIPSRPIMADVTDGADGTDGAFNSGAHPNHPRPCSAFTRERDLNPQRPEERLCPPQSTGERPRRFWPTGASPPSLLTVDIRGPLQVCGASPPRAPLCHELPHTGGNGIGLDDALDGGHTV